MFFAVKPYIRRNIIKGSYSNQEHYLDVQFRLMREDLVGPLRDGIELWRKQQGRAHSETINKFII